MRFYTAEVPGRMGEKAIIWKKGVLEKKKGGSGGPVHFLSIAKGGGQSPIWKGGRFIKKGKRSFRICPMPLPLRLGNRLCLKQKWLRRKRSEGVRRRIQNFTSR